VTLETIVALAGLQTRVDRKYVITRELLPGLLAGLAERLAALEIDGARSFRYESMYFDTADLAGYRGAAHGRRRRFKVRTRTYLDSETTVLEVKTRGGRGETVKQRIAYPFAERNRLTPDGRAFVEEHVVLPAAAGVLFPTLATEYRRATLVDLVAGARVTCDARLFCRAPDGWTITLPDRLLLETKSAGSVTLVDLRLWAAGHRPASPTKYCVGLAALDPQLPANRWNLVLRRHFGWTPSRTTG
jgi:VTC domain-containing protein